MAYEQYLFIDDKEENEMKKIISKKILIPIPLFFIIALLTGCFQPITTENQAPVITSEPVTTANRNQLYTYEVEATDPDRDALTYSLTVTPAGMVIDSSTGVINWTPNSSQIGEQNVMVMVSDGDKEVTQSFTITVRTSLSAASRPMWIYATAYTYQTQDWNTLQNKLNQLENEGKIRDSYHFKERSAVTKGGGTRYDIEIYWRPYPNATGYKVYRSVGGDEYKLIYQGKPEYDSYYWCGIYDEDVRYDNYYAYFITAYGTDWETDPSMDVKINTFLPPCYLISPAGGAIITEPQPAFTWKPVGLTASDFPYGSIVSCESDLYVEDSWIWEVVWRPKFANMTTSSAFYNQDGKAAPLQADDTYTWESWGYGYDDYGNLIAISMSEIREFTYKGK